MAFESRGYIRSCAGAAPSQWLFRRYSYFALEKEVPGFRQMRQVLIDRDGISR